jgi:segregation and condensation protein A
MDGLASDSAWDNWDARIPATGTPAAPMLHLDGFDGPMDLLLDLAERQKIDFGRMSVLALAEQFAAAMARFGDSVPIERRADWLVIATRLVLLRSRLLFPESPGAAEAAARDAAAALLRIDALAAVRAAAAWLGDQPVLGQDVFARGAPDRLGVYVEAEDAVDVIAFLWASLSLFDDDMGDLDTVARYRPAWADLHSVPERLMDDAGDAPETSLRRSSAWAATFSAGLELAKQGEVILAQADAVACVHVSRATAQPFD